ncbi:MAG: DnaA ATPase domain-containing protein, partial [Acidimicrobiales bacterium]
MWLSGVQPVSVTDSGHEGVLILGVPNSAVRERVESRFVPLIEGTLASIAGQTVKVRLQVLDEVPPPVPPVYSPTEASSVPEARKDDSTSSTNVVLSSISLDSRFTFDTFVAASSNRLAHAAAQAVAETPGRSYNPLYIYGESGLGKTHLLHAIGNYVRENFPRRTVLYVTTETFMNDFVDSLRLSTTIAFKRRYRECDVLLIDDIQFMQNKEGLQEEFFHTYNDLHGTGKQIVLTSDRPPKSIETLEDRLRSRF